MLSQTDLYLLNTELQLHPVLQGTDPGFHLIFNLVTGTLDSVDALNRILMSFSILTRFDGWVQQRSQRS